MLHEMGQRHGTDKWDANHSFLGESYLDVYERYFEPFRFQPLTVLELGVKRGGSLRMWKEYFPNSAIHGVDVNPRCQEEREERITVHTLSQDDEVGLTALAESVGGFDLVLDDASHINTLTAASFRTLWPHVKAGGFYIIEDMGMTWVDYSRLGNQDTFMDGELKVNMDRGVAAEQDRSPMDAIFREIQYGLDNRLGEARYLHFWHGSAIIRRADRASSRPHRSAASAHLHIPEFLPADRHRALVDAVNAFVAGDPGADIDGGWHDVEAATRAVAGLVRKELGIPHFSVDGVVALLRVHGVDGVSHVTPVGSPGRGTQRIDFVYTFSADGAASPSAVETAETAENSIVFFPSSARGDIAPVVRRGGPGVRYTLHGWLTGEPVLPNRQH